MKFLPFILVIALLAGCARFDSQPISSDKTAADFDARSLTNEDFHAFLETIHAGGEWPRRSWDLNTLTLAAFYYQPALAEAHAQWVSTQASKTTAGGRPNPTVSVTPGYDTQIPQNPSPWLVPLSFDVPIETAGKRGKRIAEAELLSEVARWNLAGQMWQTRNRVRGALLNLYASREDELLLAQEESAQSNVTRLLEGQFAAGSISSFEVTQSRLPLQTTQLARQDAVGQYNQARAQLAGAVGVPLSALRGVEFAFDDFGRFPRDLTAPEIRRQALLNRADVRGALGQYAASQAALQLEIANQYPDVHLGPGYAWNNGSAGDSEWTLGLTVTLPVLNQNQGPIAEARAKRAEAATHFLTVQATAVSEIDSALACYDSALKKSAAAKNLLADLRKQLNSVRARAQAGEVDALTLANAEAEYATGAQNQMDALVKAQQALGELEGAVQSPLTLPPKTLDAAENHLSKNQK